MSLNAMIGSELVAVLFVRDYVQFQFEAPQAILSANAIPGVQVGNDCFTKDKPGWRDALCSLIDHRVTKVEVLQPMQFRISFDSFSFENSATLYIPLDTPEVEPAVLSIFEGRAAHNYVIRGE